MLHKVQRDSEESAHSGWDDGWQYLKKHRRYPNTSTGGQDRDSVDVSDSHNKRQAVSLYMYIEETEVEGIRKEALLQAQRHWKEREEDDYTKSRNVRLSSEKITTKLQGKAWKSVRIQEERRNMRDNIS